MNNEDKIFKYTQIIDNLTSINQKIDTLSSNIKSLNHTLHNSLTINNHIIQETKIISIEENINNISTTIKDKIIPNLQTKTYN